MSTLEARVAVITGAASGIGQALAEGLSERGCDLALVDVDATGLEATAKRLGSASGHVSFHHTDVSNKAQMQLLRDEVLHRHQRVDILINNAGVALAGPFETYSIDDLEWIVGINLMGVVYSCVFFLQALRSQNKSRIVNISSDFGLLGFPTKSVYCATKFGIRGFSEALRAELYDSNIIVTCVFPGPVDTQIVRNSRYADETKREKEAKFLARRGIPMDKVVKRIIHGIEKGRGRLLIGGDTYMFDLSARLAPELTNWLVAKFYKQLPFV
jgi:short-subunit dehydrogenase